MAHSFLKVGVLGIMALSACQVAADPLAALGSQEWRVTEISGTAVPQNISVTVVQPQPGMIAGTSGCNRYTGQVKTVQDRLEIGPLAGTRMMCGPEQMKVEQSMFDALDKVTGITTENGQAVLRDAAGAVVIRATPAQPPV